MGRAVVLGGSGFIGRHVAALLEAGGVSLIAPVPRGSDPGWLARLASSEPIVVVNCAGTLSGSEAELAAGNTRYVAGLVEALQGTGARLVQVGSAAEYGAGTPGEPTREEAPPRPISSYGRSKLAATRMVLDAARARELSSVVLRLFNPVGAGISPESLPGRSALLLRHALATGEAPTLGPLDATRDFFDVRDAADAIAAAAAATVSGEVINVGSGAGTTARDLVRMLADAAGYRAAINEGESRSGRSDVVAWQVADVSRAAVILGWRPSRTLRDAVDQLWASTESGSAISSKTAPS